MKNSIGKKPGKIFLELIFIIFIFSVFTFLLLRYYETNQKVIKENPRFVKIDYQQLQKEADAIGNPSSLINKPAKNVFVLTYHVLSKNAPQDSYEISYDQFKENMFALKSQGYQTISLQNLYLFLDGKKEIPDKSFVLTFDDAAKAGFYNADPILKALNYTAVMFVITGHSLEKNQSAYYINETELLAVEQTGRWEIESHTYQSHFRLPIRANGEIAPALTNKLWIPEENRLETNEEFFTRVSLDLTKAKNLLETKLNNTVNAFALPYGDFGERGSNYAEAHIIIYNLTTSLHKLVFYEFPIKNRIFKGNYVDLNQDSHIVARLPADSLLTPDKLLQRIEASRTLELPYSETYTNYDRWVRISGEASFEKDMIKIKKAGNSSDDILFSYLDGSYLWRNYIYSIQLKNSEASTISLLARLTVSADYISCQYNKDGVNLIKSKNSILERIESKKILENLSLVSGTDLSISVEGSNVTCYINGRIVINTIVPEISPQGGVGVKAEGFKSEDKTFNFGGISIRKINPYESFYNSPINKGLVLYYPFNNEAQYGENSTFVYDFSLNGNNGIVNNAKWDNSLGPNQNGVFSFNGKRSSIKVEDSDSLSPSKFGQKFTVSFWIKFDNTNFVGEGSYKDYIDFLGKGSINKGYEWGFRQYNSSNSEGRNNRISFYAYNLKGGLGSGSYFQENIGDGEWIYITGVINNTHIAIYKNGVLKDSNPLSQYNISMKNGGADFYIGKSEVDNYFNGSIDELRIYNRSLNDSQVKALYDLSISKEN